ncbi:MAG: helix-turn-helix transcriptional regulator [Propionibacteriaceae bacterium]|jgi:DNA-binding CsgD family transcriptional regulator|nr:helix-turn-helix transcriptional regulator [Propionibacteriaceae bacterium]
MNDFQTSTDGLLRSELPAKAIRQLHRGVSVLVTGLPRAGRSRLLWRISEQLREGGYHPLTISGDSMLTDQPLSCLAMGGVDVPASARPASLASGLPQAVQALEEALAKRGSVLLVDDAEYLDWASVCVITALRRRRRLPLVIGGVKGLPIPETMAALVAAAQPMTAMPLPDMLFAEIGELIADILDGPVATAVVSMVAGLSGGLPGLVESIVTVCADEGRLVKDHGVWVAAADLYCVGIGAGLMPMLRGLDEDTVMALSRLAAVEGISQADAERAFGAEPIDHLIQRGLVRIDMLAADPGLYVFPSALSLRLQQETIVPQSPAPIHARLSPAMTAVSGIDAPSLAHRLSGLLAARRDQAWQEWCSDPVATTGNSALLALFSGGSLDLITAVFDRTRPSGQAADQAQFAILKASYMAVIEHDLSGALLILGQQRGHGLDLDRRLAAAGAHLRLICEQVPDCAELDLLLASAETDDYSAIVAVEILIAQGKVLQAAAVLSALHVSNGRTLGIKELLLELAMVIEGRLGDCITASMASIEKALAELNPRLIVAHAYVATLGLAMEGRFTEIEGIVELVYRLPGPGVVENYFKTGVFFIGAFIASWQGREGVARALAAQARSLDQSMGPFPAMYGGLSVGAEQIAKQSCLWNDVAAMLDRGFIAAAIALAVEAVEADPASPVIDRLRLEAAGVEGLALQARLAYVEAVAAIDIEGLLEVIDQLRAGSGGLDVTRALVTHALLLRSHQEGAGWLAAMDAAWLGSSRINCRCVGLFDRAIAAVDLSEREIEVAHMVANGMTTAGIANRLTLSVRTIEAHLRSIYRKVGVNDREDLGRLLHSWLAV